MSAALNGRREAFLVAYPAGHSVSPAMHNAAFASLGIDASYRALEVRPDELPSVVAGFRTSPVFLGANVTVPHKRSVMALLDEVTAEARSIGAVNTIVRRGDRLIGSNTDAAGFALALAELSPEAARSGDRALLLGAGGSARAVAWALLHGGATGSDASSGPVDRRVGVFARRHAAALELVRELVAGEAVSPGEDVADWLHHAALLVNTTPVGMAGGGAAADNPAPAPLSTLPRSAVVIDLVYRPRVTPLLAEAERSGLVNANGLAMLVWQGVAAFETWTGERAPAEVMRTAALAALDG